MDFEYEGYVPGTSAWAQVNKVGGGTGSRRYVGKWEVTLRELTEEGRILLQTADLDIPLPATHAQAAKVAFEFIQEEL